MYNNFSSKKTKKVISALLASALVVTSAPITADAATKKATYAVGVKKSVTKTVSSKIKSVTSSNKKVVTVKKTASKKYKITAKKTGSATVTVKYGKTTLKATIKVVAIGSIKKKSFATTLTAKQNKSVSATVTGATNAKYDTFTWTSSDKKVVTVSKSSTKMDSKKIVKNTLKPLKKGSATITVTSKATGKKLSVKVNVKAASTVTPAPSASTAPTAAPTGTPSATPASTPAVSATPAPTSTATGTATPAPTSTATGTATPAPTETASGTATPAPTKTPEAATCGAITVTTNATGASVKVISGDSVVATGVAVNGVAVIPNIANGDYKVEVSQTGFNTASKEVTVKGDVATEITLEVTKEFTAAQIGRQTILVTGEDLTNKVADYTLVKGNTSVAVDSVEVSTDGKSATLKSASSNLAAGTYTLKFNKSEYTFSVVAEKVDSIELVGTNLVLEPNTTTCTSIGFKVLNQFGERTGANVNTTCTLAVNSNVETIQCTKNADGKINVKDMVGNIIAGTTTGTIVIVDTETGVNVSKTVTVTAQAAVDSIKVAGLYKNYNNSNKATKVDSLTSDDTITDYAVLVKAYDQYGKEANGLFDSDNVTITATGTTGITVVAADITEVTIGDETYLAIPLRATSLVDGSTTLTIVGNTKGLLGTAEIKVTKPVKVSSLKISPSETLYNGTKTEISYIAKDSTGEEVTDFDALNALGTSIFTPANNQGVFQWSRQKDGSAKLYFTPRMTQNNPASATASQVLTITTQVGTSVDVATFTIYNAKKATAIIGFDSGVALAAIKGGSDRKVTLKAEDLRVQDQYGNIMTDTEFANSSSTVTIVKDGTNTAFASNYDTAKNVSVATSKDVVFGLATTNTAGKTKFKFALKDVDNSDYTVTMQSVDIEDVDNFEIGDFDTLYVASGAGVSAGIDLKVTGRIGGTTVNVTKSDYNVVGTKHLNYNEGQIFVKDNTNGDLTIFEAGSTTKLGSTTEKLEVIIKNEAGKSITKNIALSSVDKAADSVVATNDNFQVTKGNGQTIDVADINGLLTVKDQYNVAYAPAVDEPRVQFTNIPDKFTVANNNTKDASLTIARDAVSTSSKTFTVGVKVTYASGLIFEDTLVVSVLTDAEIAANALATYKTSGLTFAKTNDGDDGTKMQVELQVGAGAGTTSGNITIDGVAVAVAQNDTAAQVAAKIVAAKNSFTNWSDVALKATGSDTVVFTAKTAQTESTTSLAIEDTNTTGVGTASGTVSRNGVAPKNETYTLTCTAANGVVGDVNIAFGGKTFKLTLDGSENANAIASAIQTGFTSGNKPTGYTASVSGNVVTFTADSTGNQTDAVYSVN